MTTDGRRIVVLSLLYGVMIIFFVALWQETLHQSPRHFLSLKRAEAAEQKKQTQMSRAPLSSKALWQFAYQTLVEAEQAATQETSPRYQTSALTDVAEGWQKLDTERAKRLLERAWQVSERIKDVEERSFEQKDIALAWAGISVVRAKILARRIRDDYWREFAIEYMPQYAALADLNTGVTLLNALPNSSRREDLTCQTAYDLMRENPTQAALLILKVQGVNHDSLLHAVVSNLAEDNLDGARDVLRLIKSPEYRDESLRDIVKEMAKSKPEEAAALAQQVEMAEARAEALSAAASGLAARDAQRAKSLADEAVKLAQDVKGAFDKFRLVIRIAPLLASMDREKARVLLEEVTPVKEENNWLLARWTLELAGAWAPVDIKQAETLLQLALQMDKEVCVDHTCVGSFVPDGFEEFIVGLAHTDSRRAAALLKEHTKTAATASQWITQDRIIEALKNTDVEQARTFAEACGGKRKKEELEQQLIADKARVYPAQAEKWLPQIRDAYERDTVAGDVAVELAKTDLTAAKRITRSVKDPSRRADALRDIGRFLLQVRRVEALTFFQEARAAARQEKSASHRAWGLARIARAALSGVGS